MNNTRCVKTKQKN